MGIKIFGVLVALFIITYLVVERIRYHNRFMVSTKIKNIQYQRAIMNAKLLVSLGISVFIFYTVLTFDENSFDGIKFNIISLSILLMRIFIEKILTIIFRRKIKRGKLTEETTELSLGNEKQTSSLNR